MIIGCLVEDGRQSVRTIASAIGMSPPAVGERLSRLERLGIIRGYRAEIDWELLGFALLLYVRIICVQGYQEAKVAAALEALPEVERVDLITGDADVLVRVRLRDTRHLRRFLFDDLWGVEGIARTETTICLDAGLRQHPGAKLVGMIGPDWDR